MCAAATYFYLIISSTIVPLTVSSWFNKGQRHQYLTSRKYSPYILAILGRVHILNYYLSNITTPGHCHYLIMHWFQYDDAKKKPKRIHHRLPCSEDFIIIMWTRRYDTSSFTKASRSTMEGICNERMAYLLEKDKAYYEKRSTMRGFDRIQEGYSRLSEEETSWSYCPNRCPPASCKI